MLTHSSHSQIREYKAPSAEGGDLSEAQVEQLGRDVANKKLALEQWAKTAFEEVRPLKYNDRASIERTRLWRAHDLGYS